MTHVYAPDLYEPRRNYRNAKNEAYLRENVGIDPAILALAIGVPRCFVLAYQRRLGLRKMANQKTEVRV